MIYGFRASRLSWLYRVLLTSASPPHVTSVSDDDDDDMENVSLRPQSHTELPEHDAFKSSLALVEDTPEELNPTPDTYSSRSDDEDDNMSDIELLLGAELCELQHESAAISPPSAKLETQKGTPSAVVAALAVEEPPVEQQPPKKTKKPTEEKRKNVSGQLRHMALKGVKVSTELKHRLISKLCEPYKWLPSDHCSVIIQHCETCKSHDECPTCAAVDELFRVYTGLWRHCVSEAKTNSEKDYLLRNYWLNLGVNQLCSRDPADLRHPDAQQLFSKETKDVLHPPTVPETATKRFLGLLSIELQGYLNEIYTTKLKSHCVPALIYGPVTGPYISRESVVKVLGWCLGDLKKQFRRTKRYCRPIQQKHSDRVLILNCLIAQPFERTDHICTELLLLDQGGLVFPAETPTQFAFDVYEKHFSDLTEASYRSGGKEVLRTAMKNVRDDQTLGSHFLALVNGRLDVLRDESDFRDLFPLLPARIALASKFVFEKILPKLVHVAFVEFLSSINAVGKGPSSRHRYLQTGNVGTVKDAVRLATALAQLKGKSA